MVQRGDVAVERWRVEVLDATSTAIAVIAALWGAAFLLSGHPLYGTYTAAVVTLPLLILPAFRWLGVRRRSALLVLALSSMPLTVGATGGATVGTITGALMAVVAAGTLLGVGWAVGVWVLTIVLMALGWTLAAHNPAYSHAISDVRVGNNGVRMLATYIGLSSVLLFGVVVVIRRLSASLEEARLSAAAEQRARIEAEQANERREGALRQMVEAQRYEVMGQLAGMIAHDVSNSLQFITLQASLIADGHLTPTDVQAVGRDLVEVCDQASATTRQMLTLGQRTILDREVVDLEAELSDIQRALERVLPSNVLVRRDCKPGLRALIDRVQLKQVMLNLTINAAHAMSDGGKLTLSTRAIDGSMVEIAVRDTGVGMEEEILAKIFEPFFTTKGQAGTGLGLPAVKAMIEQHGGQIRVESRPRVGTTVRLQLPAHNGPGDVPPPTPTRERNLDGCRVLIVDDDPRVRQALDQILRAAGASVVQAGNGDAALKVARANEIDVLCTDAIMPGLPTRELIDRFRAQDAELPVLVCSAYVESELLRRGIEAKTVAFLAKPFSADQLIAKIGTMRRPRPSPAP